MNWTECERAAEGGSCWYSTSRYVELQRDERTSRMIDSDWVLSCHLCSVHLGLAPRESADGGLGERVGRARCWLTIGLVLGGHSISNCAMNCLTSSSSSALAHREVVQPGVVGRLKMGDRRWSLVQEQERGWRKECCYWKTTGSREYVCKGGMSGSGC